MLGINTVLLMGERLSIQGDVGDQYFAAAGGGAEMADSVMTGALAYMSDDAVCLDIGANLGFYSIALARKFPTARIFSFEPVPRTFECLAANLAVNAPQCVPVDVAIGASNRVEHMNFAEHFAAGSHFSSAGSLVSVGNTGDTDIEVQVQTLDATVESLQLDRIDVVKIDVEGFETDVLSGGEQTLTAFKPVAQIEFNSWAFTTHRRQLPQEALDCVLSTFPFVYVLERHGDRLGRVSTEHDRLSLLRANMLHGCVDNLLCGFEELAPTAPAFGAVWEEFTLAQDRDAARLAHEFQLLKQQSSDLEREHAATLETLSWRVTRPLRAVRSLPALRSLRPGG